MAEELGSATWGVIALAALLGQVPRLTQTVSALGAVPRPMNAKPVYALQLAQGYVGLAVPSSAARVAMNIRFFQKQGFSQGAALAIGVLDSLAGFAVEAVLLASLLLFTPQTLHFDLDASDLPGLGRVLAVLVALAVVFGIVTVMRADWRHQLQAWVRGLLADSRSATSGLRSPRRLLLLVGGNLGSILAFSATLGLFAAGMPEEPAFASVVLYRLATFYLPPLWGYPAFRWLERHDHLWGDRARESERTSGASARTDAPSRAPNPVATDSRRVPRTVAERPSRPGRRSTRSGACWVHAGCR